MKSLNGPLQRNVFGLRATVVPTIMPSSALYSALPPFFSQPSSDLPSKREIQASSAEATEANSKTNNARENGVVFIVRLGGRSNDSCNTPYPFQREDAKHAKAQRKLKPLD